MVLLTVNLWQNQCTSDLAEELNKSIIRKIEKGKVNKFDNI